MNINVVYFPTTVPLHMLFALLEVPITIRLQFNSLFLPEAFPGSRLSFCQGKLCLLCAPLIYTLIMTLITSKCNSIHYSTWLFLKMKFKKHGSRAGGTPMPENCTPEINTPELIFLVCLISCHFQLIEWGFSMEALACLVYVACP